MTEKKKKQHYVPRFYLKSFARQKIPKKFIIRFFNKETGEKHEQNITQVAMEKYFYDDGEPPIIENRMMELEGYHSAVYHKIINDQSIEQLTMYDKFMICHYLMIQNERTRSARVRDSQVFKIIYQYFEKEENYPPFESFNENYKQWLLESRSAVGQFNIMLNPVEMKDGTIHYPFEPAIKMTQLGWILLKNNLEREFYTSDHPVRVFIPPENKKFIIRSFGSELYTSEGVEIYFPLTPRLCLVLFDKTVSDYRKFGLMKEVIQHELDWINTQIIAMAHRTVFAKNNDFQFVCECIQKFPELKDPNRIRL